MGPCGATVGLGVYALFGVGAYLAAVGSGSAARALPARSPGAVKSIGSGAALGAGISRRSCFTSRSGIIACAATDRAAFGEYGAELLVSLVGRVGAVLFGAVGCRVSVVLSTPVSVRAVGACLGRAVGHARRRWCAASRSSSPSAARTKKTIATKRSRRGSRRPRCKRADDTLAEKEDDAAEAAPPVEAPKRRERKKRDDEAQVVKIVDDAPEVIGSYQAGAPMAIIENEKTELSAAPPVVAKDDEPKIVSLPAPKIVEPVAARKSEPNAPKTDYIPAAGGYHLPEVELLDLSAVGRVGARCQSKDRDARALREAAADARELRRQGRRARSARARSSRCTSSCRRPAPLSKIVDLADDLAMALEALRVRIVAPIPGKGVGRHRGAEQDAREGVPEGDPRRRRVPQGASAS